jgi:hypothetical protein
LQAAYLRARGLSPVGVTEGAGSASPVRKSQNRSHRCRAVGLAGQAPSLAPQSLILAAESHLASTSQSLTGRPLPRLSFVMRENLSVGDCSGSASPLAEAVCTVAYTPKMHSSCAVQVLAVLREVSGLDNADRNNRYRGIARISAVHPCRIRRELARVVGLVKWKLFACSLQGTLRWASILTCSAAFRSHHRSH